MREIKFTPGPWEIIEDELTIKSKDYTICEVFLCDAFSGEDQGVSNARLISAAPEMYEALKRALLFITNGRENGYIRMPDIDSGDPALETPNIIRMALAKADGKA